MTKKTNKRGRYLTHKMVREIRHLYFAKNARGALEYGERLLDDPTAEKGYRHSHDCSEWPLDSDLYSPYDLRDGVGKIELREGVCLDLYVYVPTCSFDKRREDWELYENICVRFNGTEWERAEYPKQRRV